MPQRAALPLPDYRAVFESTPGMYLVLTPDLTIVAATDVYLRQSMTERDQIVGRHLLDVFPDNPDDPEAAGVTVVTASIRTVLRTKQPHAMAALKYDIRRPASAGGGFEERYWSLVHAPVLDGSAEIALIVQCADDVTERVQLQRERDILRRDLRQTADDLNTVRGLIPLCAWCKKVRDDRGSWQQLEAYFTDRTDATFTHSVCTDCARGLKR